MAMDFKLPDLGEGIHEAQVVNVLVKEGDTVKEDQMVLEVETDKAAVELPVPYSGVISKLHVKQGDTVKVGTVLLSVEAAAGAEGKAERREKAPERAEPRRDAARPARPREDEEEESEREEAPRRAARAEPKREAGRPERAPETAEEEPEQEEAPRAERAEPKRDAGRPERAPEGEEEEPEREEAPKREDSRTVAAKSAPAETVGRKGGDGKYRTETPPAVTPPGPVRYEGLPAAEEPPVHGEGPVPAAPAVRKLAREMNIDLHGVRGTGPGGRVVREDVERFAMTRGEVRSAEARDGEPSPAPGRSQTREVEEAPARKGVPAPEKTAPRPSAPLPGAAPAGRPTVAAEAMPDFAQWGPVRKEKVSQIRKTIARQMARSWNIIPHVTHADEADVTDLENFRKEQSAIFADKGTKLTLTAFLLKATVGALQQFPQINASYDDAAGEIIFKDYFHIGVAVDTPRGLMVPVIRDADRKGLVRLSKELKELADRAREFKIDLADLRGGTFTLTNVGPMGGTVATPIINYPEAAILGVGKLEWKAVVRNGQIIPRKMLPLFLSFDHRIVDGVAAAQFIRTVIAYLENPLNLLLAS